MNSRRSILTRKRMSYKLQSYLPLRRLVIERLEDRHLLASILDADCWGTVLNDGLLHLGGKEMKPYVFADLDLLPYVTAIAGSEIPGVGTLLGYGGGTLLDHLGVDLKGRIAFDLLDLIGQTRDGDGQEGGMWVTTYFEIFAGVSFSIGLSDLSPLIPGVIFRPAVNANDDPVNSFTFENGYADWFVGNMPSDCSFLPDLEILPTVGIRLSTAVELNITTQIRSDLSTMLAPVTSMTSRTDAAGDLLSSILSGKLVRGVTADDNVVSTAMLPLSPDRPVPFQADQNDPLQTFDFSLPEAGDASITYNSIDGTGNPLIQVVGPNGQSFLVSDGRAGLSDLPPGEYYVTTFWSGDNVESGTLTLNQGDPGSADAAQNVVPRVFHDSAGQDLSQARNVSLSSTNKGDDVGRIAPKDDKDFYRFVAQTAGPIEVDVIPQDGLTSLVTLYDGQLDQNGDGQADGVDSDASDSADGISHLTYDVVAGGVYYVAVESKDQKSTGQYELHIRSVDPATAPGNSGTDTPPGPLPGWGGVRGVQVNLDSDRNGHSSGSIDDPTDVRWFQVDGASAGNMLVQVLPVNDDLKPFVTVFRANGGGIDTDTGEFDGEAKVGFRVAENERIIVAVSSHDSRYTGGFTLNISQPGNLPNDPESNSLASPRDLNAEIDDQGNGAFSARIQTPADVDCYSLSLVGEGYVHVEVEALDSTLVPFLELNRDGSSGGFFETDDGRDGRTHVAFLPSSDTAENTLFIRVSALDGTQGSYTLRIWRSQNPDDDHPDSGGAYAAPRTLPAEGQLFISGRTEYGKDNDAFRILLEQPGPVMVQVISLTDGFRPFLKTSASGYTNTDGGSGRGGRTLERVASIPAAPNNWLNLNVGYNEQNGGLTSGDYIVHVWQPKSADDRDADTVGIEASPILLDGQGIGSLPGSPNGSQPGPSLDYVGDKDVFQVVAAANRPITFRASGVDAFLRVYNGSGEALATDHASGASGASEVTLEANRGDVFYIEISAFDGVSTGAYTVQVSQAVDDHPDKPIFQPVAGQVRDATEISLNAFGFGQATGQIEDGLVGDRDLFQVTAAQEGQFTINVVTTDNRLDTFLRVYDSRGNLVAIDDDGGDGRNSRVTFSSFMDETYFLEVSGYNDASVGNYQITVQASQPPGPTKVGIFDGFAGSSLDLWKWNSSTQGRGSVVEDSGVARLTAQGTGANDPVNSADLVMRGYVQDGIEFDVTPQLGTVESVATIQIDNAASSLKLQIEPDAGGNPLLSVQVAGLTLVSSAGPISLVNGTKYHLSIQSTGDGIDVLLDGQRIARLAGSIPNGTTFSASVQAAQQPLYDNFNDGSIDGSLWNHSGDVEETDGRLHLWLYHNGQLQDSRATTQGKPGGQDIHGFKLNANRTAGTVSGGQAEAWVGITNGTDYVRMRWLSDVNQMIVETGGAYGEGHPAFRWDPDQPGPAETPDGPFEIRERDGNIEFLHDNTVKFVLTNQSIRPGSWFEVVAYGATGSSGPLNRDYELMIDDLQLYTGDTRFAQLELDNVAGTIELPNDPTLVAYDNFNDNSVDFGKWEVSGIVEEHDSQLNLAVFRNSQPVEGYASTQGMPGGTNLRGFKLNFNRTTEPKNLATTWDVRTRLELTNGVDWIRIENLHQQTFVIETGGSYGDHRVPVSVPSDQIPDGPFEVRERDGNIEVLHNGVVKLTLVNQTVRGGSYFVFETNGNPEGQFIRDQPDSFEAWIDDLEFYVDRAEPMLQVTPELKQTSDSGVSTFDYLTNQLGLDFQWPSAGPGIQYEWREGELLENGTIVYGVWSAPITATTAHVDLPHASIPVFSVRTIGTDGIAGPAASRAVSVDVQGPRVMQVSSSQVPADPVNLSTIDVTFSEAIDPATFTLDDITAFTGPTGDLKAALTGITGAGARYTVTFTPQTAQGTYELVFGPQIADLAGNLLDQNQNGTGGEESDAYSAFVFTQTPWQNPSLPFDVDRNGRVDVYDILTLIAELRSVGPHVLLGSPSAADPYFDVDGNNRVDVLDVVDVIRHVRQFGSGEGESQGIVETATASALSAANSLLRFDSQSLGAEEARLTGLLPGINAAQAAAPIVLPQMPNIPAQLLLERSPDEDETWLRRTEDKDLNNTLKELDTAIADIARDVAKARLDARNAGPF